MLFTLFFDSFVCFNFLIYSKKNISFLISICHVIYLNNCNFRRYKISKSIWFKSNIHITTIMYNYERTYLQFYARDKM